MPELAAGLERLVARVGFSGVFEAEFIDPQGQAVLIDFNPRFYNQMGFDIARGLPLPLLAYYDALGSHAEPEGALRDPEGSGAAGRPRLREPVLAARRCWPLSACREC